MNPSSSAFTFIRIKTTPCLMIWNSRAPSYINLSTPGGKTAVHCRVHPPTWGTSTYNMLFFPLPRSLPPGDKGWLLTGELRVPARRGPDNSGPDDSRRTGQTMGDRRSGGIRRLSSLPGSGHPPQHQALSKGIPGHLQVEGSSWKSAFQRLPCGRGHADHVQQGPGG